MSSTEKLSHPTTSRPKATGRRPPSQSLTSVSASSLADSWKAGKIRDSSYGLFCKQLIRGHAGRGRSWDTLLARSDLRVFWNQAVILSFCSLCICQRGGEPLVPLSFSLLPDGFLFEPKMKLVRTKWHVFWWERRARLVWSVNKRELYLKKKKKKQKKGICRYTALGSGPGFFSQSPVLGIPPRNPAQTFRRWVLNIRGTWSCRRQQSEHSG